MRISFDISIEKEYFHSYMEKRKTDSMDEFLNKLAIAAASLTQEQIDACAWVMGGSGADWTKGKIIQSLLTELD